MKRLIYQSHAEYLAAQTSVNLAKLNTVWVQEATIAALRILCGDFNRTIHRVLCHGTRNGAEQKFFRDHFDCQEVLGTEVSDTATLFPDTIQWDFHEMKPEWVGYWDLVYTNAWDHAYDIEKALDAWMSSLRPGGVLALEHTESHRRTSGKADCLAMEADELQDKVVAHGGVVLFFDNIRIFSPRCPATRLLLASKP